MSGGRIMQPIGGKKAMAMCILKVLEECSDPEHPMTYGDIGQQLSKEYGIEAGRNAIGRNISLLKEMGNDISTYEENGKGAYLRERLFDDMELRVLIDSVITSRFIPANDANQLVKKLSALSTRFFRQTLPQVQRADEWYHQRNKEFFWNLETISQAILLKKQISFCYNSVSLEGNLLPRKSSRINANPFAIICANSQYYLIASAREYDEVRHFRIDRITKIESTDFLSRPIKEIPGFENGLNLAQYAKEHNFMYGGIAERIKLKVKSDSVGDIWDAFGASAKMKPISDDFVEVEVFASIRGMRFFALQFGMICEVLSPETLRQVLRDDIRNLMEKYS